MSKKGNPVYKSFGQVCIDLDAIMNDNPFDITLLDKYNQYFKSIKKFTYLDCDDLESSVISDLLYKNKKYKCSFINKEILKEYFNETNVNSAFRLEELLIASEQTKPKSIKSAKKTLQDYIKSRLNELIIDIAAAHEWEDCSDIEITSIRKAYKNDPSLKKVRNLIYNNPEIYFDITALVEYKQDEKLYEWFSEGAIDVSQLSRFVDISKSPSENIDYFMEKCNFPNSRRETIGKVVRGVFKNGTLSNNSQQ